MIRIPKHAGTFYPENPKELESLISELFSHIELNKNYKNLKAVVVPHAGYIYSGLVASVSYKILQNYLKNSDITTITLIGPSHYHYLENLTIDTHEEWKTPLGNIKVDTDLKKELLKNPLFVENGDMHEKEHSLEVQIPFIQYISKKINKNLEILPIVTNYLNLDDIKYAAKTLSKISEKTIFIISSDLSHYNPYNIAVKKDEETIKNILSLDTSKKLDACGDTALKILMEIVRINNWKIDLGLYQNSGDVTLDYSAVVGYASLVIYKE